LIPDRIQTATAARLLGIEPRQLRAIACDHGLTADLNNHPRSFVERELGREITPEMFLKAETKGEVRRRQNQRAYRNRRV
jgi:hypothetical protein